MMIETYEMLIKITITTTKIFLSDFNAYNKNQNCADIGSNNEKFEKLWKLITRIYIILISTHMLLFIVVYQKSNLDLIFFIFSHLDKLNKKER